METAGRGRGREGVDRNGKRRSVAVESVKLEKRLVEGRDRRERLTQIGGNYTRPTRLYNIQELRQVLKSCQNFTPATFMHIQKSGEGRKRERSERVTAYAWTL